jgi:signal peptidase I
MSVFSHKKPPTGDSHPESIEEAQTEHPLTEIVRFSIIAILIVIPIRMFIAQPFIVSGASMDDTFTSGQYLIIDQVSYYFEEPDRGDVIVFRYPKDPSKFFIKRVIALPGETISINDSVVTISNNNFPDGFILTEQYIKSMQPAKPFTETLGGREYFVMGDNRDQSSDSRNWGVLQEERIVGRVLIRLFPPSVINYLPGAIGDTNENFVPQT